MPNTVLSKGERLLWSAKPRPGILFRVEWLAALPLLAVGCWMSSAILSASNPGGASRPFMLLALVPAVFVIVIAAWLIGLDLASSLNAEYQLTDHRIIVATRVIVPLERSIPLSEVGEVALRDGPHGSGSVIFRPKISWAYRLRPPAYIEFLWFPRLAFDNIANPRHAYNLVLQAIADYARQDPAV